jgi:hypothetical protein
MELLIATLAHTRPAHESDGPRQIRQVSDLLRSANGLVAVRSYTSRDRRDHLMLTTWESGAAWRQARERHSPALLLQEVAAGQLMAPPEQWAMRYIWGYVRPAVTPTLALALLARVRPEQAEALEQGWLESLHKQAAELLPASAFLARGCEEDGRTPEPGAISQTGEEGPERHGDVFLNILCWAGEIEQEEFYAHASYQNLNLLLQQAGLVYRLVLEQP